MRILLASKQSSVRLTAAGGWRMFAPDGTTLVAVPNPGERWVLEPEGSLVSARREDSRRVPLRESPIVVRPLEPGGTIGFNGRHWRGELLVSSSGEGLTVVNRLRMDDYVRGVVPLEIGTSAPGDAAAVEAQAVTARSYAVTRLGDSRRGYDMTATTQDQVYGGADVETSVGNAIGGGDARARAAVRRRRRRTRRTTRTAAAARRRPRTRGAPRPSRTCSG